MKFQIDFVFLLLRRTAVSPFSSHSFKNVIYVLRSKFSTFFTRTENLTNPIRSTGCYRFKSLFVMKQIKVSLVIERIVGFSFHSDETMYLIAMHLNLFVAHCFPQWSNIFLIAKKIIAELLIHDEEFHRHLHTISKRTPKINPKVNIFFVFHSTETMATNSNSVFSNEKETREERERNPIGFSYFLKHRIHEKDVLTFRFVSLLESREKENETIHNRFVLRS